MAAGIEERHSRAGRTWKGGRCDCEPTYRVRIRPKDREPITHNCASIAEAISWRKDVLIAVRRGRDVDQGGRKTLRTVAAEWLAAAEAGTIRARGGAAYKPSATRSYEASLRLRVYGPGAPMAYLGDDPIEDIRRADLQDLIARLIGDGHAPRTVEATIIPLRAIFAHEVRRDRLKVNPTAGLDIPRGEKARERIADRAEARTLLAAVDECDRATWATAMYAGLRRGELMALRANRIDLDANVIRVEKGWDVKAGEIGTKNGKPRTVPIPAPLRELLLPHLLRTGRRDDDLVFGSTATEPFEAKRLRDRADTAWTGAKLRRITLHECRHTFASYMIAAGVNVEALSTFMGHASVAFTLDRYGHLFPGAESEAGGLLDTYLGAAGGHGA